MLQRCDEYVLAFMEMCVEIDPLAEVVVHGDVLLQHKEEDSMGAGNLTGRRRTGSIDAVAEILEHVQVTDSIRGEENGTTDCRSS